MDIVCSCEEENPDTLQHIGQAKMSQSFMNRRIKYK